MWLWILVAYMAVGMTFAHYGDRELVRGRDPQFTKVELFVAIFLWWFIVGWIVLDWAREKRR